MISRGQKLFGVDAVMLHQAAQWIKRDLGGFDLSGNEKIEAFQFARAIGMPSSECIPVLCAMVKAEWLTKQRNGQYLLKQPFQQLAAARIGKPLQRAKADLLIAQMIARAKDINRATESDCGFVLEIAVFGSYLDETRGELGDLDIGIKTQRRLRSQELPLKRFDWREKSEEELVRSLLKGRSPYISVHDISEIMGAKFKHRLVYSMADDLPMLAARLSSEQGGGKTAKEYIPSEP